MEKTMRIIITILLLGLLAIPANAAPLVSAAQDGKVVTLTDEPCVLQAVVNLPYRVTWAEKGVITEGCYRVMGGQIVLGYFADRTVVALPLAMFRQASEVSAPKRTRA